MSLTIGEKAPQFEGKNQNGDLLKLSQFRGKKVVLYFYPNDDTPGCTAESCNLRDNYDLLIKQGYEVIGISSNDEESHQNFIKKYDLPFDLIADTEKSIHAQFDTWKEKSMFGNKFMGTVRTTFIIDENGVIEDIIKRVKTDNHTAQIIK